MTHEHILLLHGGGRATDDWDGGNADLLAFPPGRCYGRALTLQLMP